MDNMLLKFITLAIYINVDVPVVQFHPVNPALQVHTPSVCRQVLQLGEQQNEQCLP